MPSSIFEEILAMPVGDTPAPEASKQYAKALTDYEKGLALAPTDEYFKESVERVKPFAK